jgi:hypothetical protein
MPRIPKKENSSFINLREFLLIGRLEESEKHNEDYRTGREWVALYEAARNQHKLYGMNIPLPTVVAMTRSGFGGPQGIPKVIPAIERYGDEEYYLLVPADKSQEDMVYYIDRSQWWAYCVVIPAQEQTPNVKELENIL